MLYWMQIWLWDLKACFLQFSVWFTCFGSNLIICLCFRFWIVMIFSFWMMVFERGSLFYYCVAVTVCLFCSEDDRYCIIYGFAALWPSCYRFTHGNSLLNIASKIWLFRNPHKDVILGPFVPLNPMLNVFLSPSLRPKKFYSSFWWYEPNGIIERISLFIKEW